METYSFLREFADSWVLLLMTAFFIGAIVWAFRPGSREVHEDIANIPFRNESIAEPGETASGDRNRETNKDFGQGSES